MSSLGVYGFYKNGVDKITKCYGDSYPTGLGKSIMTFIQSTSIEEMSDIFSKIIMVDINSEATKEQFENCKDYFQPSASNTFWYDLLRKTQDTLEPYKKDLKYMIDNKDFIKDSFYCDWGYIINLDNNELEIYIGYQIEQNNDRYKINLPSSYGEHGNYYSCKLYKSYKFDKLSKGIMKEIENEDAKRLQAI